MKLSRYNGKDIRKMVLTIVAIIAVVAIVAMIGIKKGVTILKPKVDTFVTEMKEKAETKKNTAKADVSENMQEENLESEEVIEPDIPEASLIFNGHSYYYFERDGITWEEARKSCEERGGHLVTITSQEEQDAVYSLVQKTGLDMDVWIGIWRDETESPWSKWVTGEDVIYTNWGDGEPDEYEGQCYGAICNGVRSGDGYYIDYGQWDDLNNDDPSVSWGGYICEWDMAEGSENDNQDSAKNETNKDEITITADYIIPDSSTRYLEESDLENLTAAEIRLARNEIYARHGRLFADEEIQAYFDSKDWYEGSIAGEDFKESMLNDYERENTYLIVDYEAKMGY